ISVNCAVPEQRNSSYIIISVEEMTAPAARIRSSPMRQFHSERELTASEATCTRYPSLSAPNAVCITQIWASMPHSNTVLRLPGSALSPARKASLPKQPNSSLSMAVTSGSRELTSGTVAPSPLLYWVVIMIGMDKTFARRTSSCEFLTSISLLTIGGSSFCWMSTTIKAHCPASDGRRATSVESVENATVSITDDIELPPQYGMIFILACCSSPAGARHRNFASDLHALRS